MKKLFEKKSPKVVLAAEVKWRIGSFTPSVLVNADCNRRITRTEILHDVGPVCSQLLFTMRIDNQKWFKPSFKAANPLCLSCNCNTPYNLIFADQGKLSTKVFGIIVECSVASKATIDLVKIDVSILNNQLKERKWERVCKRLCSQTIDNWVKVTLRSKELAELPSLSDMNRNCGWNL